MIIHMNGHVGLVSRELLLPGVWRCVHCLICVLPCLDSLWLESEVDFQCLPGATTAPGLIKYYDIGPGRPTNS